MFANEALEALIKNYEFKSIIDIGAGSGDAAKKFMESGYDVTSNDIYDFGSPNTILGDFSNTSFPEKYDIVWASHVLEHQLNVNKFLTKCRSILNKDGYICVTVPPLKHEIVGGHVTLWNAGLLLYNLVLAGFNCKEAAIKTYGYNISVIAPINHEPLPKLKFDYGDIETLSYLLPEKYNRQGFNGVISELNWPKKGL